jgi:NADPH:quinone reductase
MANTALQLRSLVKTSGELELSLVSIPVPAPMPDEVVIRVEASPLNPSDLGILFGTADMSTAKQSGTPLNPVVTANIPEAHIKSMKELQMKEIAVYGRRATGRKYLVNPNKGNAA